MIERIKESWREFKQSKPGHRFQDRYRRRRQHEQGHILLRVFNIALGAAIAVGSLVLAPLPGPGWATVFLGLAILAGELLPAARFLDWAEVRLRKLARFARDTWRASAAGKASIVSVVLVCVVALGYAAYYFLFGG